MAAIGIHRPRIARFYGLFHVIGAGLMALIAWYVVPILIENYDGGYYKGTAGVMEIPVWPFMATVILGAIDYRHTVSSVGLARVRAGVRTGTRMRS